MSKVDNRVVHMTFDNVEFLKGAQKTVEALSGVETSINKLSTSGVGNIAQNVEQVNSKLGVLGSVGFAAIQKVTHGVVDFGAKLVTNFTKPLFEGGRKRALNIEQASFQFKGLGMDVEASMKSANDAVLGTAYGLDEAARLASMFGATGMKAGDEMTTALRGVAGVAAMSGAGFMEVGDIFTNVAGKGRAMTEDFNRLSSRGINGFAVMADHLGTTQEEVRKLATDGKIDFQTFSEAFSDAFGEHATKSTETYTGALAGVNSAIARIGQAFISVKLESMRDIFNALTPVINTFKWALTPLINVYTSLTKSGTEFLVGVIQKSFMPVTKLRLWLGPLLNILLNLRDAFISVVKPITNAFKSVFTFSGINFQFMEAVQSVLLVLVGFTEKLILSENAANNLQGVFTFLFNQVKKLGAVFTFLSDKVSEFLDKIRSGADWVGQFTKPLSNIGTAVERLQMSFHGLDITSAEGFKDGAAKLGNGLVDIFQTSARSISSTFGNITSALEDTAPYQKFKGILDPIVQGIKDFGNDLADFVSKLKFSTKGIGDAGGSIKDFATNSWNSMKNFWNWMVSTFSPGISGLFEFIARIFSEASEFITFDKIITGLNVGLIMSVILNIKDIFATFSKPFETLSSVGESFQNTLDAVTEGIQNMQKESKPNQLIKIAIAIGIMAAAVWVLAQIEPIRIASALGAITGAVVIMSAAMFGLTKVVDKTDVVKLQSMSTTILILSGALLVMSLAIKELAKLSWGELAVGLVGVGVGLGILIGGVYLLSKIKTGDLLASSFAMVLMAGSIYILSLALRGFTEIDPEKLGDGLVAFAITMGLAAGTLALLAEKGGGALLAAIALGVLAISMGMLVGIITSFSLIPWDTFLTGFAMFAIVLGTVTAALFILGQNALGTMAAGLALGIVAISMGMLVASVVALGMIDMPILIQGILMLAVILGVLVIAINLIKQALPGVAGLFVLAAAINILVPAIAALGALPFEVVIRGIAGLALALGVIVLAAMGLTAGSVGLGAFAVAVLALGVAAVLVSFAFTMFMAALGSFAIVAIPVARGMDALGTAAKDNTDAILPLIGLAVGIAALAVAVIALGLGAIILGIGLMAMGVGMIMIAPIAHAAGLALKDFINVFGYKDLGHMAVVAADLAILGAAMLVVGVGTTAAAIGITLLGIANIGFMLSLMLLVTNLDKFVKAMDKTVPVVGQAAMLATSLSVLGTAAEAGGSRLKGFGKAIDDASKGFVKADKAILKVIISMTKLNAQAMIMSTGVSLAFSLMATGMTTSLTLASAGMTVGTKLIVLAFTTMRSGVTKEAKKLNSDLSRDMRSVVKTTTTALRSMATSFSSSSSTISSSARTMLRRVSNTLTMELTLLRFLVNGQAITVGLAIAQGMAQGLYNGSTRVNQAARTVAQKALNTAKNTLGVASPSKEGIWLGEMFDEGFAKGLVDNANTVERATSTMGNTALVELEKVLEEISAKINEDYDDPVIKPIVDLTDVETKAAAMSSIFDSNPDVFGHVTKSAYRASVDHDRYKNSTDPVYAPGETKVFNYTQNNNSPKALSQKEIYRQTKNQLSTVKGAIETR